MHWPAVLLVLQDRPFGNWREGQEGQDEGRVAHKTLPIGAELREAGMRVLYLVFNVGHRLGTIGVLQVLSVRTLDINLRRNPKLGHNR